jgi:hypothetical protein
MRNTFIFPFVSQPVPSVRVEGNLASTTNIKVIENPFFDLNRLMQIKLTALPYEILLFIMRKIDMPLMLSTSCQQFHTIYQNEYTAHERQYHILMHNLATRTLREALYAKLIDKGFNKIIVPAPNTDEWKALRDQALYAKLTGEARHIALIQKIYVTTWDLLLQPQTLNNRQQAAELMRLLRDVSPHIQYAEEYAEKLFNYGLDWQFFHQLADIHLDRCLQLVGQHFSLKEGPARDFIVEQIFNGRPVEGHHHLHHTSTPTPKLLYRQVSIWMDSQKTDPSSILLYLMEYFYRGFYLQKQALETMRGPLHMFLKRGCDFEQKTHTGKTVLIDALCRILQMIDFMSPAGEKRTSVDKQTPDMLAHILLQYGAAVKATDKEGYAHLMTACKGDQKKLIPLMPFLLECPEIDVNATDNHGKSALHYAVERQQSIAVKALLKHQSIYVNIRDRQGNHALHYITTYTDRLNERYVAPFDRIVAETLLNHPHIDVNATNDQGRSVLEEALVSCRGFAAMLLAHPQININVRNNKGEDIFFFIARGADLSRRLAYNSLSCDVTKVTFDLYHKILQHPKFDVKGTNKETVYSLCCELSTRPHLLPLLFNHRTMDNNTRFFIFNSLICGRGRKTTILFSLSQKTDEQIIHDLLQTMDEQERDRFINQALVWAQERRESAVNLATILQEKYGARGVKTLKY